MIKADILFEQNCILKFFAVICGTVVSLTIQSTILIIIFGTTLLYFLVYPRLYFIWLKTLLILVPFFISIVFLGILFKTPFPSQILLLVRISFILLLSVYLSHTSSLEEILSQFSNLKRNTFIFSILHFFVSTFTFIPLILFEINFEAKNSKNIISIIVNSFNSSLKKINEVEDISHEKIHTTHSQKPFWNFPNLYLMLLITVYNFSVSV